MFVFGAIAAGIQMAGGFMQAAQIRKQTEERLRLMRIEQAVDAGKATAMAGATGVEMTSGTIQTHLLGLQKEWERRLSLVNEAGVQAEMASAITGAASGVGTFASNLYKSSQVMDALGDKPVDPNAFMDEPASKLNDTLGWRWDK
jgi:NADPH:quinone reductase-like Zn-dependent oxidoreductase